MLIELAEANDVTRTLYVDPDQIKLVAYGEGKSRDKTRITLKPHGHEFPYLWVAESPKEVKAKIDAARAKPT